MHGQQIIKILFSRVSHQSKSPQL